MDKDTGEVLKTWKNPWTGEAVDVLHVANDPVSMREPTYAYAADGTRRKFRSDVKDGWALDGGGAARLFYTNPLGGDYQEDVCGTYHAMGDASGLSVWLENKGKSAGDLPTGDPVGTSSHFVIQKGRDPWRGMVGLLQYGEKKGAPRKDTIGPGDTVLMMETSDL